jgi:hypothetical protein
MLFIVVEKENLKLQSVYEAETKQDTDFYWGFPCAEPYSVHLPLPEILYPDCIKAVLIDEVITLVEDADKVAAKAQAAKDAQISMLRAQCDADIETQQLAVYGTKNQSAALATQQSWSDIEANPERYVPMMFPTLEDVAFWITPRMAAARQFAAWRFQRIVTRDAAIAAL